MPNLLFCMTPGVGLGSWERIGSLNKELRPYVEYVRRGWKVKILTFDRGKIPRLPDGITAIKSTNRNLLWFLALKHKELGTWADLIKTNQSLNGWYYVFAARIWKKPVLLRCGYVHGEYLEVTRGKSIMVKLYQFLESLAFRAADYCQVPTKELSEWVQRRYKIYGHKINIVPNFVDTEIFKPAGGFAKKEKSVISIGRLEPVKRFDLLIAACAQIAGCSLTIIGEGSQRQKLARLAEGLKVNLALPGNIANENLPEVLNQHQVFALTSAWEGHPKALLEAMACGLPSVIVKATGTTAVAREGVNCCLAEPDVTDIKNKLLRLLNDSELFKNISKQAREFVLSNFTFRESMSKEFEFLSKYSRLTFH